MDCTDQALMQQIQNQDEAAFEALLTRYAQALRRHLNRTVREPAAADDLLQEVFLRLWTRAEQWSGHGSVKSWLYQIATNLALNHLRARRRHPQQPLDAPAARAEAADFTPAPRWLIDPDSLDPDAAIEQAEEAAHLWGLVERLPPAKQTVFELVHRQDLPISEAARQLGLPEGTIKSRLHYGLKILARKWEESEWEELP